MDLKYFEETLRAHLCFGHNCLTCATLLTEIDIKKYDIIERKKLNRMKSQLKKLRAQIRRMSKA